MAGRYAGFGLGLQTTAQVKSLRQPFEVSPKPTTPLVRVQSPTTQCLVALVIILVAPPLFQRAHRRFQWWPRQASSSSTCPSQLPAEYLLINITTPPCLFKMTPFSLNGHILAAIDRISDLFDVMAMLERKKTFWRLDFT